MAVRRALLVHNSRFTDPELHPLPAADADVERLRDLLCQPFVGFAPDQVITLANPSLTDFRTAVSRFFRDADTDDYLFFYYAGHGIRSETGELYLALRNTRVSDFEAMSLEASFIRRALSRCMSEKKIVVLDCCNAGAFRQSGHMIARDAPYDPGLIAANFDPKGTGTYILGASQSGASAYETVGDDGTPYSLFTDAFIRGVETGQAAPDQPVINMIDISRFIHSQRNAKGQATQPYLDVTNSVGLLEFAQNKAFGQATDAPEVRASTSTKPKPRAVASAQVKTPRHRSRVGWIMAGLCGVALAGLAYLYLPRSDQHLTSAAVPSTKTNPPSPVVEEPSPAPAPAPTPPTQADTTIQPNPVTDIANAPEPEAAQTTDSVATPDISVTSPAPAVAPATPPEPASTAPAQIAVQATHTDLCTANPRLDLDLSDPQIWQNPTGQGLVTVTQPPAAWDPSMRWLSGDPTAIPGRRGVMEVAVPFCSCADEDALADIRSLRADNGILVSLDGDTQAVNFGTDAEIDMFSTRSTPFSAKLKSHKVGQRTLVLRVENKTASGYLGFAVNGRLQAAQSYAGRCRD